MSNPIESTSNHCTTEKILSRNLPKELNPPKSFDWRDKQAVTPVKKQGSCGESWAFVAAGMLEAHLGDYGDRFLSFSVQNLIDCATKEPCNMPITCMGIPFAYIKWSGGLMADVDYKYEGTPGLCRFNAYKSKESTTELENFQYVSENLDRDKPVDKQLIKWLIVNTGPLSVEVSVPLDADSEFIKWKGDKTFADPKNCNNKTREPNHAMLAIGYDVDDENNEYLVLKNSFGTEWGYEGFIHWKFGDNLCGVEAYVGEIYFKPNTSPDY